MKKIRVCGLLLAGISGIFLGTVCAQAQENETPAKKNWEIGIDLGMIYMTKGRQFIHSINNQVVYDLLGTETAGDEIAEGMIVPPLPGSQDVVASIKPVTEIGGHFYYFSNDEISLGVEGGWANRRSTHIDNPGAFHGNFLTISDEASLMHAAPVVRFNPRFGRFCPTLTVGPEWTRFYQRTKVAFSDPDDAYVPPMTIIDKGLSYAGVLGGVGIEWLASEAGSLQIGLTYHKVFASSGRLDYISPQFRFVAKF